MLAQQLARMAAHGMKLGKTALAGSSARLAFTPISPARSSGRDGRSALFRTALSHARYQEMRLQRLIASCSSTATAAPAEAAAAAPAAPSTANITSMDIRIGKIVKVAAHPDADTLYVEEIDVGEAEGPRTIVSGLVKFVSLEEMQDRKVVVLCNLKPRNMRGVKSNGMLLCASNEAHDQVQPLTPPEGAVVGERVYFGEEGKQQPAPAEPNRVQKKKLWEETQPLLKTDGQGIANWKGQTMLTSAGPVTATLPNGNIS